jgi:hypothetical protein
MPNPLTELAVRYGCPLHAINTALPPIEWVRVALWRFAELVLEGTQYITIEPGLSISTDRTAMVDTRSTSTPPIFSVDINLIPKVN